jgi:hypothetical protein
MQAEYVRNSGIPAAFAPKRSEGELAAADAVKAEAMRRLQAGNSLLLGVSDPGRFQFTDDPAGRFQIDPALLRAGAAEKALGWGSVAGQVAGQVPGSAWGKVGKTIGKGALKVLDFIF